MELSLTKRRMTMAVMALAASLSTAIAQTGTIRVVTLDSCKAMALHNNKTLSAAKVKEQAARNIRKSTRTKYLPRVQAIGAYMHTSKQISILSDEQKQHFSNLGTGAQQIIGIQNPMMNTIAGLLNAEGKGIVDAFNTDTRDVFGATVMMVQPIFMGGSIIAANRIADLSEEMASNSTDATRQSILFQTEETYWMVVSLAHKRRLASSYLDLLKKLDSDVKKLIREGIATKAEGLHVAVKVNEAEMTLAQVEDGLSLSRMLLCQLCGWPLDKPMTLAEENVDLISIPTSETSGYTVSTAETTRPELRMLQNAVDISRQQTRLLKAGNLPKMALVGGYSVSNPNLFNGFQKEFAGLWNVGVMLSVPLWNWGDVAYKVRASKNATTIAQLELSEAREKVELQVNQNQFKNQEAMRKLTLADHSCRHAEENLRCANLGFQEGVVPATTVMEAQTAWLNAKTQKIDAEIAIRLSETELKKALGILEE